MSKTDAMHLAAYCQTDARTQATRAQVAAVGTGSLAPTQQIFTQSYNDCVHSEGQVLN